MNRTGLLKVKGSLLGTIIALAGFNTFAAAPANDSFQNAKLLSGSQVAEAGNIAMATRESGDPTHVTHGSGTSPVGPKTLWYRWQAPYSGKATFSTGVPHGSISQQSNFDTQLGIYTVQGATSIWNKVHVASNEDGAPFAGQGGQSLSWVEADVTEGVTYYIMLAEFAPPEDANENFILYINPPGAILSKPNLNSWWWQNPNTGQIAFWNMNGLHTVETFGTIPNLGYPAWSIITVTDWDGNGAADFFLQNNSGQVVLWLMGGANGTSLISAHWVNGTVLQNWKVAAVVDMNGDGTRDLVWQSIGAPLAYWTLGTSNTISTTGFHWLQSPTVPNGWDVVGVGNFTGTGRQDVLWENAAGQLAVWPRNADGTYKAAEARLLNTPAVGSYWRVGSVRDFNGDGSVDVMWQGGNGELAFWPMNNLVLNRQAAAVLGTPRPAGWNFVMR